MPTLWSQFTMPTDLFSTLWPVNVITIHMPAIWPVFCSFTFYQHPEASGSHTQKAWMKACSLCWRYPCHGGVTRQGEGYQLGPDLFTWEPGVHRSPRQETKRTNTELIVHYYTKLALLIEVRWLSLLWVDCSTGSLVITGPMETRWSCLPNNCPTADFNGKH